MNPTKLRSPVRVWSFLHGTECCSTSRGGVCPRATAMADTASQDGFTGCPALASVLIAPACSWCRAGTECKGRASSAHTTPPRNFFTVALRCGLIDWYSVKRTQHTPCTFAFQAVPLLVFRLIRSVARLTGGGVLWTPPTHPACSARKVPVQSRRVLWIPSSRRSRRIPLGSARSTADGPRPSPAAFVPPALR